MGSSSTQDLGGDFKHGVIKFRSMEPPLFDIGGETKPDSTMPSVSVATESEGLEGVGSIATNSGKTSFVSPLVVSKNCSPSVVLDVTLSNSKVLEDIGGLDDRDFDMGRGVSINSCLPLWIVQSARQDTRGEGEINDSKSDCSGLSISFLSTSGLLGSTLSTPFTTAVSTGVESAF
jgi:hypothetical protein